MHPAKQTLYHLLHWAYVEVRYHAHEGHNQAAFDIANAVHNLPLQLLRIETDADYVALLTELETDWQGSMGLSQMLNHVKKKHGL